MSLAGVTIRYYFTSDGGTSPVFVCNFASMGCGTLSGSFAPWVGTMSDHYLEIAFTSGTVGPGGTAAPIEVTLRDDYATVSGQVVTGAAPEAQTTQANPIFIMGIPLDRPEAEPMQSEAMGQGTSLPESVSLGLGLSMQPNQFMMPNLAPGR